MKKWMLVAVCAFGVVISHPALAQEHTVTCTGTLIGVWVNPEWALAVIYDAAGKPSIKFSQVIEIMKQSEEKWGN